MVKRRVEFPLEANPGWMAWDSCSKAVAGDRAIQPAQADCLADVVCLDTVSAFKVGDGAGHLQDSVGGSHGEPESLHSLAQQCLTGLIGGREPFHFASFQGLIGFLLPLSLPLAGIFNSLKHHMTMFHIGVGGR